MFKLVRSYKNINGCAFANRYVVDPVACQEFNRNSFGWLKSDISALLEAQTLQLQDNIMSRLTVLRSTNFKGLTDAQILKTLVPRYCQSYQERENFFEYLRANNPDLFAEVSNLEEDKKKNDVEVESVDSDGDGVSN